MSANIPDPSELGFAEFTAMLITETLDSIIFSYIEQEKRVQRLLQESLFTITEIVRTISEEEVREEIIRLFPDSQNREGRSSVDEGEPYSNSEGEEKPPIKIRIDYTIKDEDIKRVENGNYIITSDGYENIHSRVKEFIAFKQLETIRTIISRGIPRVYVDNGKISTRLTIKLVESSQVPKKKVSLLPSIKDFFGKRLLVKPVNSSKPEYLTLRTDIISEVEITFKTITP